MTSFQPWSWRVLMTSLIVGIILATPVRAEVDYTIFKTPSGNILCGLISGPDAGVRCDIFQYTPSYSRAPSDCQFDWGSFFWVGAGSWVGELACVSDAIGSLDEALVLPYGQTISRDGITCASERTGLTCANTMGHGFMLSKAVQEVF